MTVYSDNAAGRLHELISAFSRIASQQLMAYTWAAVLGMSVDDGPEFLRRLALVFSLPGEIEREILKVSPGEFDGDLAMRWSVRMLQELEPAALLNNLSSAHVVGRFDKASLNSLEYCSYVLHEHRPQRVFPGSELERIRLLIAELETAVRGAQGLDPDLCEFLLFHAEAMAQALRDLPLRGPAALEDAFDQALGAARRRADLSARGENRSTSRKFGELIVAVAAVLQITTAGLTLPGQIRQELEGPAPAAPPVVKIVVQQPDVPAPAALAPDEHPNGARAAAATGDPQG